MLGSATRNYPRESLSIRPMKALTFFQLSLLVLLTLLAVASILGAVWG